MKTPEQQHICSLLNCFTETKSSPGIISDAVQNMKPSPAIFLLTNMTKYANIAHEFPPPPQTLQICSCLHSLFTQCESNNTQYKNYDS